MSRRLRVFVCAGEASGDQTLARILARLRDRFPDLECRGFGGEASERQGLRSLLPLERMARNGIWDVLRAAPFLWSMARLARRTLRDFRPDLVILVDYPGLNLGLARLARSLSLPVYYVAPPQAWVYRRPARKLARASRALQGAVVHVLFPFETADFAPAARKVVSGHFFASTFTAASAPAVSAAAASAAAPRRILCLCPGSRPPVMRRNLEAWLAVLRHAGIAADEIAVLAPSRLAGEAARFASRYAGVLPVRVTSDPSILSQARLAIAHPGTITLELALNHVPMLILALADPLTLALGRRLLRGTLGLPNLLLGEQVFPEWAGTRTGLERAFPGLWRRLCEGGWDWEALSGRLQAAMGPGSGPETAARECAGILEKGVIPVNEMA